MLVISCFVCMFIFFRFNNFTRKSTNEKLVCTEIGSLELLLTSSKTIAAAQMCATKSEAHTICFNVQNVQYIFDSQNVKIRFSHPRIRIFSPEGIHKRILFPYNILNNTFHIKYPIQSIEGPTEQK